ncbi:hypothetical protein Tco_1509729 [Tanacetum coccineum]
MKKGFLSAKWRRSGKGVKEKHNFVFDVLLMPNDSDYDIWLPLALIHEVNDRMKNSLSGNFIELRLAFPFVGWANDEGFIEVRKKKSGGKSNKTFKLVLVKPKTFYHPKEKQLIEGTRNSPKMTLFAGTNKASKLGYNKEPPSIKEERESSTPTVEKINVLGKQNREGKLVLVNDNGKPLEKVDYSNNLGSDDEFELFDIETANFLASKPRGQIWSKEFVGTNDGK